MNYPQALEWVHSLPRMAGAPGVENTRILLQKLGNPERQLQFVHIAGTNGKGSTAMMLSSVLRKAGYRTGTNISPYVLEFTERFLLDGQMIGKDTLADILTQVRTAAGEQTLVEFDAVTAAALVWFAQEKCDIVCLEVGLGGRLDSTNAIENTLVACIMAIGKDHTELLGDTDTQIAAEKCGIFKNRCEVICTPQQSPQALAEIKRQAAAAGCALVMPEVEDLRCYKGQPFENRIHYGGYDVQVPFAGLHQAYNAMVVVQAALALCDRGFDISDEAIVQGIEAARFPARIEVLSKNPLVILDGAHNPDGAKALAQTLQAAGLRGLTAVVGVLQGKQPLQILQALRPYLIKVYTVAPQNPRALSAQELAQLAQPLFKQVQACDSVQQALAAAQQQSGNGLLICGSLYLAAEARKLLCNDTCV